VRAHTQVRESAMVALERVVPLIVFRDSKSAAHPCWLTPDLGAYLCVSICGDLMLYPPTHTPMTRCCTHPPPHVCGSCNHHAPVHPAALCCAFVCVCMHIATYASTCVCTHTLMSNTMTYTVSFVYVQRYVCIYSYMYTYVCGSQKNDGPIHPAAL